jgi:hypothetical protein
MKILIILFNLLYSEAFAYVGPGMSFGISIVIVGVILATILLIFALIIGPIRKFFLKSRK